MAEEKNKVQAETVDNKTENTVSKDHSDERNLTENTLELILGEKGYDYYLNNKKHSCCSFCVCSLNTFSLEIH